MAMQGRLGWHCCFMVANACTEWPLARYGHAQKIRFALLFYSGHALTMFTEWPLVDMAIQGSLDLYYCYMVVNALTEWPLARYGHVEKVRLALLFCGGQCIGYI